MTEAELIHSFHRSLTFPSIRPVVARDSLIDTIEKMFSDSIDAIVVEGEDEIGKTALLAEFTRKQSDNAAATFLNTASRWAYDPGVAIHDLLSQLAWIVDRSTPAETSLEASKLQLGRYIYDLAKRSRSTGRPFYLVVDGITDIPLDESDVVQEILRLLPFGLPGFRFIMSGDIQRLRPLLARLQVRGFQVPYFSIPEAATLLSDVVSDPEDVVQLHIVSRALPGRLASIRRLLLSGHTVESLRTAPPKEFTQLLEMEWTRASVSSPGIRLALGVVAHDTRRYTLDGLASLSGVPMSELKQAFGLATFISTGSDKTISFISDAFHRFATDKLADVKTDVFRLVVEHLRADVRSAATLTYLPKYLQELEDYESLLALLSPEHFSDVMSVSQSFGLLRQRADMGIEVAQRLERDAELFRFALHRSTLAEIENTTARASEVRACLTIGEQQAAIAIARAAQVKEDRLQLLAMVAADQVDKTGKADDVLVAEIKQLHEEVDLGGIGDRANAIAADLVSVSPELAVGLVESANRGIAERRQADWQFARLSLAAAIPRSDKLVNEQDVEAIQSHIADPRLRSMSAAIAHVLRGRTGRELLEYVAGVTHVKDRLYILRTWLEANTTSDDAALVAKAALDSAIRSTETSIGASLLRAVAAPLPHVLDKNARAGLSQMISGQLASAIKLGPTEDYVRLLLLLAESDIDIDASSHVARLMELRDFIGSLPDLSERAVALAHLLTAIDRVDPAGELRQKGFEPQSELIATVDSLLVVSADHLMATKRIVEALAVSRPVVARGIASELNTKRRRDRALQAFIRAGSAGELATWPIEDILLALGDIGDVEIVEQSCAVVAKRLSEQPRDAATAAVARGIVSLLEAMPSARQRALAAMDLRSVFDPRTSAKLVDHLTAVALRAWRAIDSPWVRIETGFDLANDAASTDLTLAGRIIDEVRNFREGVSSEFRGAGHSFWYALKLAIRAFAGLLPQNIAQESDRERLLALIAEYPAKGGRAELLADLIVYLHYAGQQEGAREVARRQLSPLVEAIAIDDEALKIDAIVRSAAAHYLTNRTGASALFDGLPERSRDAAYVMTMRVLAFRLPQSEPYDEFGIGKVVIEYDVALEIADLIRRLENDGYISGFVELVAQAAKSRIVRQRTSDNQRAQLVASLHELVRSRLPRPGGIRHEGYRIVTEADVCSIAGVTPEERADFSRRASMIPNVADRALVGACIAGDAMSKDYVGRARMLDEVEGAITAIPFAVERVEAWSRVVKIVAKYDVGRARRWVKEAMREAANCYSDDAHAAQRRLVDLAHRVAPEFADSLIDSLDDDEARSRTRDNLRRRVDMNKLKSELADGEGDESLRSGVWEWAAATWSLLGELNAGTVATRHAGEVIRVMAPIAARAALSDSYPLLAWSIANAVARHKNTPQARAILLPMFEGAMMGASLAGHLGKKAAGAQRRAESASVAAPANLITVRPGERERFIQRLVDWCGAGLGARLLICDPYFGPEELEFLPLVKASRPECKVFVLTSKKHQQDLRLPYPLADAYGDYWRTRISAQLPPSTEIVVANVGGTGKSPVHERRWVTDGAGIEFGTSLNAFGGNQQSELRLFGPEEAAMRIVELQGYLTCEVREEGGRRISYESFTL